MGTGNSCTMVSGFSIRRPSVADSLGLCYWKKKSYPLNIVLLAGFTACESYHYPRSPFMWSQTSSSRSSFLLSEHQPPLRLFAFRIECDFGSWQFGVFGGFSLLTLFGSILVFLPDNRNSELFVGAVGVIIFSVYLVVDTHFILQRYYVEDEVAAAITLLLGHSHALHHRYPSTGRWTK